MLKNILSDLQISAKELPKKKSAFFSKTYNHMWAGVV